MLLFVYINYKGGFMKIICSGENEARIKFPESYYVDGGYCIIMSMSFDGGRFITRDKIKAEYNHYNNNMFVSVETKELSDKELDEHKEHFRSILFTIEEFNNSELAIENRWRLVE